MKFYRCTIFVYCTFYKRKQKKKKKTCGQIKNQVDIITKQ